MFRKAFYIDNLNRQVPSGTAPGSGMLFLLPGLLLIGLGILILIMPELLAAMVAAFFIFVGISLLGLGLNLRRLSAPIRPGKNASWENF
jgi:hypothetical protein